MVEGDRLIKLYKPSVSGNAAGVSAYTFTKLYEIYATRRDRTGSVREIDDQRASEWTTAFTIRAPLGDRPEADWRIVEAARGEQYVIEHVGEISGSRGGKLRLLAVRSTDKEELPE